MRFLVLGAGAVGGYFGGRLAEAGRDVTFLVRRPRAAAFAEHGLKVESQLGDFQVPVKTATADRVGGPYDVVLLTAKHYDLDAAIEAIRPGVGPQTAVLPLLNGLVHLDGSKRRSGPGGCSAASPMSARCCCRTAPSATSTACPASLLGRADKAAGISERARAIERGIRRHPGQRPGQPEHPAGDVGKVFHDGRDGRHELPVARQYRRDRRDRTARR